MATPTPQGLHFNKDADLILAKARKLSMGWAVPGPALCEELIFLAFIDLKHPLYITMSRRFSLSTNHVKNALYASLLTSQKDEPSQANKSYEKVLLDLMHQESQKDAASAISEQDVMAAIFQHKHPKNAVSTYFSEIGVNIDHVLAFVKDYKRVDFIVGAEKPRYDELSGIAGSRRSDWANHSLSGNFGAEEALERFGKELTQLARESKLSPTYGREREIALLQEILLQRHQNNAILIGPPGVGKTAIVQGFAQWIAEGKVSERLREDRVWQIDLGALVAGTSFRGQFEERVKQIMEVCEKNIHHIVYFADIHQLVGAGDHMGATDAASLLKPALTRSEIRCIGTTTVEAYYRYIEKDASLAKGFQVIRVAEPSILMAVDIVNYLRGHYEKHHQVTILPEAVEAAVEYSDRYIGDRALPGKALSLLDQTCARVSLGSVHPGYVTRQNVAEIVSEKAQIPLGQVLFSMEEMFQNLEEHLKQRVIGQDAAIHRIAEVVQLTKYELDLNPRRPDGVFLLAGPTGIGKTELAKALAECLLGSDQKLLRFDMSEFHEKHTIAKLIGAPPGYEGSAEGGMLTNAIKANPYSVILFDEIEKAHPDLQRIFLQIFDDGRLTDAKGMTVSFSHSTILMTTNLGARDLDLKEISNLVPHQTEEYIRRKMEPAVKAFFSPEFLNRLNDILFLHPLSPDAVQQITRQKVSSVLQRLEIRGLKVIVDETVYRWLRDRGYSLEYGARFLNRTIEEHLLNPLAKLALATPQAKAVSIVLTQEGTLAFDVKM